MSETPFGLAPELLAGPNIPEHLPKKHVMLPVHILASVLMRDAKVLVQPGLIEELQEHAANDGSILALETHVSRWDPIAMAKVALTVKALRFMMFETGITAREELANLFFPLGYIVRNSGAQFVSREQEHQGETPREKKARQDRNLKVQAEKAAAYLTFGKHWFICPEGESRETVMVDGQQVRQPREPGIVKDVRLGFVYTLEALPPERLAKTKLMAVGVFHGDRRLSRIRPTIYIPRLVTPIVGNRQATRRQGQDLLELAMAGAKAADLQLR